MSTVNFCPNCGEKFESPRLAEKHMNGGSSIAIRGTNEDVFGIGTSGTGNIIGREIEYTVSGNVINLHVNDLSRGEMEDLRKIMSVQTQLPPTDDTKDDHKQDVIATTQFNETQQNITNILDEVKKIEKKEEIQIQRITAGDLQISKDYAWYNKGTILGKLGRSREAIECFDKALEINPDNAYAWYNKGTILGKLGKYKQAKKCFDKVKSISDLMGIM